MKVVVKDIVNNRKFLRNLLFSKNLVYEIESYFKKYEKEVPDDLISKLEKVNDLLDEIRSDIMENIEKNR